VLSFEIAGSDPVPDPDPT